MVGDYQRIKEFLKAGNFYWNSGMFCFKAGVFLEELKRYEPEVYEKAKIAFDNNDIHVYADLLEVLKEFNMYVEQGILLVDKIDAYGNVQAFDHDINKFWILGEK